MSHRPKSTHSKDGRPSSANHRRVVESTMIDPDASSSTTSSESDEDHGELMKAIAQRTNSKKKKATAPNKLKQSTSNKSTTDNGHKSVANSNGGRSSSSAAASTSSTIASSALPSAALHVRDLLDTPKRSSVNKSTRQQSSPLQVRPPPPLQIPSSTPPTPAAATVNQNEPRFNLSPSKFNSSNSGKNIPSAASLLTPSKSFTLNPSIFSSSASSSSTATVGGGQTQMSSLLSFLDAHEETTERDQQLLNQLAVSSAKPRSMQSPRSVRVALENAALTSPRSTLTMSGKYDAAFAPSSSAGNKSGTTSIASTVVGGPTYKPSSSSAHSRNVPRSSPAPSVVGSSRSLNSSAFNDSASTTSTLAATGPNNLSGSSGSGGGAFADIKQKMLTMKQTMNEKDAQIESLERQIKDQKIHSASQLTTQASTFTLQLTQQKAEYESTLLRHQTFIEQLIANKEELNAKVESLTAEITNLELAFEKKMDSILQEQEIKFQQRQEMLVQSEKIKREKFIAGKTKSIKSMTIKGLEPEIERLIQSNKNDLKQAEDAFQRQLTLKLEEAARESELNLQQLRHTMIQEREAALEKERQHSQQRITEQMDRSDQMLQEQRTRFHEELERQKASFDEDRSKLSNNSKESASHELRLRSLRDQHLNDLVLEKQRYESQLSLLQLQHDRETQQLMLKVNEEIKEQMKTREADLRRQMQAESKEELDVIISKLMHDHQTQVDQLTRDHQKQVTKLEDRIRTLEQGSDEQQSQLEESLAESRNQVATLTSQLQSEKSRIYGLQLQLKDLETNYQTNQQKLQQYESSRASLNEELQGRYQTQLNDLQSELESAKAAYRTERDRSLDDRKKYEKQTQDRIHFLEAKHQSEVESIQLRIKHMLEKKELVIQQLKVELESKERKMKELEQAVADM